MGEWRPIESCPKDGTVVLLFQDGLMALAGWLDTSHEEQRSLGRKGNQETFEWVKVNDGYWDTSSEIYAPTHWMPLTIPTHSLGKGGS